MFYVPFKVLIIISLHSLYSIVGIHLSNCQSNHPVSYLRYAVGSVIPFVVMGREEASDMQEYYFGAVPKETAYAHLQASKANSIGKLISS